ncbi:MULTISPECIES: hypothetical protein [unclassified Clostridium]|uniref:hypothetical protein n=1 Tax=unclassified Clostridium TaxID=2614128 RepID=UPI00207B02EF|nr:MULTISPECIES: hypothetical protein [unclassified Clostridium]
MSKLTKYIEDLRKKYGDAIVTKESHYDDMMLLKVPEPLREFYREYESLEMPFGIIDSIEISIRSSEAEPFKSEGWFSFGADRYFSFWLCAYKGDNYGNSITSWDHDIDDEIEAMDNNIIDFLNDMEEEYEEYRKE